MAVFLVMVSCVLDSAVRDDVPHRQTANAASAWSDSLVLTFQGSTYTVTKEAAVDVDTDRPLGAIAYHGNGAVFRLYAIKHIPNDDQIAIETSSGYWVALKNAP